MPHLLNFTKNTLVEGGLRWFLESSSKIGHYSVCTDEIFYNIYFMCCTGTRLRLSSYWHLICRNWSYSCELHLDELVLFHYMQSILDSQYQNRTCFHRNYSSSFLGCHAWLQFPAYPLISCLTLNFMPDFSNVDCWRGC